MAINLDAKGERPQFFDNPEADVLMTALLEAMSQVWATRERTLALERVLQEAGILAPGAVDGWVFPAHEQTELDRAQQEFLQDAFRSLRAQFQSLDARSAQIDARQCAEGASQP